jgi:hypothetical protein
MKYIDFSLKENNYSKKDWLWLIGKEFTLLVQSMALQRWMVTFDKISGGSYSVLLDFSGLGTETYPRENQSNIISIFMVWLRR